MMNLNDLVGHAVKARGRGMGKIQNFLFDDTERIRYVVVENVWPDNWTRDPILLAPEIPEAILESPIVKEQEGDLILRSTNEVGICAVDDDDGDIGSVSNFLVKSDAHPVSTHTRNLAAAKAVP